MNEECANERQQQMRKKKHNRSQNLALDIRIKEKYNEKRLAEQKQTQKVYRQWAHTNFLSTRTKTSKAIFFN